MSLPRSRFQLGVLSAGAVVVLVVGCQAPTAATPMDTAEIAAAVDDLSGAVNAVTPAGEPANADDAAPQSAPVAPPTPVLPPTPRPTPRPIPTPVPTSTAVDPAATALQAKLSEFRAALRKQDVAGSLRLQRELLAEANATEAALKTDRSPPAQSIRGAIGQIRTGVAGDQNALERADTALRQVIGGSSGALGVTLTSSTVPEASGDLRTLNEDLRAFRQAIQNKNMGDALRLQAELANGIDAAQKLAAAGKSTKSEEVVEALAELQKALDGDSTALATAAAMLDKLDTGPVEGQTAPDYAGLAASLAAKMDAFQTATSTASQGDLLRLQQEILSEARNDEAALGSDQSPQATALRDAIKSARASVSGDLTKLDGARAELGKVSGQAAASGASSAKPITDLKGFASDLDKTVGGFQEALLRNDTGAMLRLQKSLADQADQAEASLKGVQSKPAEQVLAAVGAIRAAFGGDTSKLADARVLLRGLSSMSPGVAAAPARATPNSPGFDAQAIGGGVRDKLTSLDEALRDPNQSPDEIAKRREAVNGDALKALTALKGTSDPRADRFRAAMTAAREAAAGDNAKVRSALNGLQAALNGQ